MTSAKSIPAWDEMTMDEMDSIETLLGDYFGRPATKEELEAHVERMGGLAAIMQAEIEKATGGISVHTQSTG